MSGLSNCPGQLKIVTGSLKIKFEVAQLPDQAVEKSGKKWLKLFLNKLCLGLILRLLSIQLN